MPQKSELPEGWFLSTIGEICKVNDRDHKTPTYKESGYPLISPKTFTKSGIDFIKTKYVGDDELDSFVRKCNPEKDDILYSRIGTIGESRLIDFDQKFVALHSIALIKPHSEIKRTKFAYYFLKTKFAQDQALEGVKSIGVPDLGLKKIKSMRILIPPLAEQHRIVAAIEALFARLDAAQARLDMVPGIIQQFRQAVLVAACVGRLTEDWRAENQDMEDANTLLYLIKEDREKSSKNAKTNQNENNFQELPILPDTWTWTDSGTIFSYVTSGSRGWAKYYSENGPLFIRIGNLDRNSINLRLDTIQRVQPPKGAEGRRTRVQENDILISITADIGNIGLIDSSIDEAYINQHIALARPDRRINPKYIAYFLHCNEGGKKQFEKLHRGATKIGLRLDDIRSIKIPLPPLMEQNEIVRRIDKILTIADQIEARLTAVIGRTETLQQSILAQAFSGQLVPTEAELARREGREYEEAAMLLERIQSAI